LYRLKGELTLQKGVGGWNLGTDSCSPQAQNLKPLAPSDVAEEAERYFRTAIEIAHSQQAKSIELRATICLSRLWQQQGKNALVHHTLAPLYEQFPKTHDTADLQEARKILSAN
jgi:predicted ATPase